MEEAVKWECWLRRGMGADMEGVRFWLGIGCWLGDGAGGEY